MNFDSRRLAPLAAALALGLGLVGPAAAQAGGAFLYVGADTELWQFATGPTGLLAPLTPPGVAEPSSQFPASLVELPDRSELFASIYNGLVVRPVALAADGTATFGPGLTTGGGSQPDGLALTPDGASLFVADHGNGGRVLQDTVGAGGALSVKAPPLTGIGGATDVAVAPGGTSAYVASQVGAIDAYDVTAGGLVAKAGAAATVAVGAGVDTLAITADGRLLVAGTEDGVQAFAIGAGGALTATTGLVAGPPDATSTVVSPDGRFVYVAGSNHLVYQYALSGAGALTPLAPASVDLGAMTGSLAIAPGGDSVYVSAASAVHQFDVAASGALVPKAPATATTEEGGSGITVSPDTLPVARIASVGRPAGSASAFDGSASTDADGTVARYAWDFGDGTSASGASPTVTHVYGAAGTYTATLRVTDDRGCSAAAWTGHQWLCDGGAPVISQAVTVGVAAAPSTAGTPGPVAVPVVAARRTARLVRHGSARLTASGGHLRLSTGYALVCSAGPTSCRVKVAIALVRGGRVKRITGVTSASLTVKAGRTASVVVAVKKASIKTIEATKKAKLAIVLTSTVGGGDAGTGGKVARTVVVKVPAVKAAKRR